MPRKTIGIVEFARRTARAEGVANNNDIDVALQNLGDEAGFLCERALRPAYVNGQVLPFGPAALLERFAKGAKHRRERQHRPDHGYAPNPTSLLRPRRSGDEAAALPTIVMNSRRLINFLLAPRTILLAYRVGASSVVWHSKMGCRMHRFWVISLGGNRGRPSMHFRYSPKS